MKFKIAQFQTKTLSWWKTRRTKIDMEPPYQRRGRLWSNTDKAYLIDSILNGYDVPKLYIADFTWADSDLNQKRLPYAIIDGKQRMEAIFDFYDGRVVLNDDFVFLDNPGLRLGGLGYEDVRKNYPQIAEEFDNYNLMVMSVVAQDEAPITELFVRLNRSKALTGAEIRNAMSGPIPDVVRQIAQNEFFAEYIRFTVKRGQDLNAAAKLLLFEFDGGPRETKKRNLDAFVDQSGERDRDRLELAFRRVLGVLDDLSDIFLPSDSLLGAAGVLPVYYWFVREQHPERHPLIREFLVRFEEQRKANRELAGDRPESEEVDSQLVQYDRWNRSTNDQSSHDGRFRTLTGRFDQWIEARQ